MATYEHKETLKVKIETKDEKVNLSYETTTKIRLDGSEKSPSRSLNYDHPSSWLASKLKSMDISEKTQQHLINVYRNIAICCGVCATAMFLNSSFNPPLIFKLVSVIGILFATNKVTNVGLSQNERNCYMWAISFLQGFLVGPSMHYFNMYHPEMIYQAVAQSALIFACFSCLALFTKRGYFLFLGGYINLVALCLLCYSIVNWILSRPTSDD